jgi:hypothetical protein
MSSMTPIAKQTGTQVEEPVNQLFQRLMPEVSPIAAHIQAAVLSSASTHSGGEQEKRLELVVRELRSYVGKILQECGATHGHVLVVPPPSTPPPSPNGHTSMWSVGKHGGSMMVTVRGLPGEDLIFRKPFLSSS